MNNIYPWQHEIWKTLTQDSALRSHALLLKGREGTGKFVFALSLAKFLLCEKPVASNEACNECQSCHWFEQNGHPDFCLIEPEALSRSFDDSTTDGPIDVQINVELESSNAKSKKKPSKQIGIAQIRALADLVNMSSYRDGYKIILIHPAEAMNIAAANALLKSLEEPSPKTLFLLVAHCSQLLTATIRSRCQQITMPLPELTVATSWLKQQGIKDPENNLALAGYAPLTALKLNNSDDDYFNQHQIFIRHIGTPSTFNPLMLAEEMQKLDASTTISWLQKWCYDLTSFRATGKIRYHLSMLTTIKSLVSEIDLRKLVTYSRSLIATQRLSKHPLNARLFLEEALISYAMMIARSPDKRAE
ncbi:MAG: DNA polymerase III subunit delta' [Nitrosospira sp.]|nr:DNA polymerase III subunit delta' [Nitrosospira sp.]